ncbi:hypothetical protein CAL12_20865 [Bordetella genomosp. 8]|uniref:Rhamnogalacturonase A/B/Epimerase-like pectate lyase domain-containing protein n=1 Tax=Bordetella genomosp. 8 TaxID=1416806 RepID=A0A1W6YPI8_9BORD|nr:glycosyl hydrolase family 28-related protein [Bordetella genomosp. 8]ARP83026.1 hypothetical protein CAL12_20865 [Bordetella genomosp. 8]
MASLLPNGKQYFTNNSGDPLAGGQVYFYVPNTNTKKNTYGDPNQTVLNSNPVTLDSRGEAVIWGAGSYRQVVYDQSGNLIWDQLTEDANAGVTGDMIDATFSSGSDFTPGVTTTLTLPAVFGSIENIWVFFDGIYQGDGQIALLDDFTLTFTDPIPSGVSKIDVKGGTTVAIGVPSSGSVVNASVAAAAGIAFSKLSYMREALGAVARDGRAKLDDSICVKDFGAKGDGITDDTAAFHAAIAFLQPQVTQRGGALYIPAGVYKLTATLAFSAFDQLHNVVIYGDGPVATTLDFSSSAPNTDAVTFDSGAHVVVRDLSINSAKRDGLVLGVGLTPGGGGGTTFASISNLRIQGSGRNGLSNTNSWMCDLTDLWVWGSGAANFALNGFITSLSARRCYSSNSAGVGFLINGMVYSNFLDCGSDTNGTVGYAVSNVQGVSFIGCGAENNGADAWRLTTGNVSAGSLPSACQDIHGLAFISCYTIGNSTSATGAYGSFLGAYPADNRPIDFKILGGSAYPAAGGDRSLILTGAGTINCHKELFHDAAFSTVDFVSAGAAVTNLTMLGTRAIAPLSAASQSIPNGTLTPMSITNMSINTMGAIVAGGAIVIPKGVNLIRVSAGAQFVANVTGTRQLFMYRNGVIELGMAGMAVGASSSGPTIVNTSSSVLAVSQGDTITCQVFQNSGGTLNLAAGSATFLAIEAIG